MFSKQEWVFFSFLCYFLILAYIYPTIEDSRVAWASMVLPAGLLLGALVAAIAVDSQSLSRSVIAPFIRYDWQILLILFSMLAPVSALVNGRPLEAAATSVLSLMIVLITGGAATAKFPAFISATLAVCVIGSVLSYHWGGNKFGYLPWHEAVNPTFVGVSRVSLFPNLSDSVLFAATALVALILNRPALWPLLAAVATYFLYLSDSRTAIAMIVAIGASEVMWRAKIRGTINFVLIVLMIVLAVGFADRAIPLAVKAERSIRDGDSYLAVKFIRQVAPWDDEYAKKVISGDVWVDQDYLRLFEKDRANSNPHLGGRASLWRDHLKSFVSSPLTGVGRDRTMASIERTSLSSSITGSESFFTRILAEFGVVALLFWASVWRLFVHFGRLGSAVGRGLTIGLFVTLLLYGSTALPYSFVFLCYIGLIGHVLVAGKRPSASLRHAGSDTTELSSSH